MATDIKYTNHIITCIHNFRTSAPVCGPSWRASWFQFHSDHPFRVPFSYMCAKNNVSGRRFICYFWECIRDSIRVRWPKVIKFLMLSLQNQSNTEPSLERPPKNTLRPRPKTHPLRAGPGPRKRFVFTSFSKMKYTPDQQSRKFQNRVAVQKCKSGLWF